MAQIRTKLIITFLVLSIIPLIVISVLIYNLGYDTILEKTEDQLTSETYQRANAIAMINKLRIEQLESFASSNEVQSIVNEYDTTHSNKTVDENNLKEMRNNLMHEWVKFQNSTGGENGFNDLIITDKKGIVIFAYNESLNGKDFSTDKIFTMGLTKPSRIPELEEGQRRIGTIVPIIDQSNIHADVLGVIMADTGTSFIDSVLLNREGLGNTGESYLVNSDKILITPSRFIDGVFKQKVDTFPIKECFEHGLSISGNYNQVIRASTTFYTSSGKGGFSYQDYRGIPVFGTSFCARDLGYVLLIEIDQKEVLAPLVTLQQEYAIIILVISIGTVMPIIGSTRHIIRPLQKLKDAVNDIESGKFDTKIKTSGTDEISTLAIQFDKMRNHVKFVNENLQNLIKQQTSKLDESNRELVENQIKMNQHMKEILETKTALDEAAIVATTDKDGTIIDVNQKFCDISKYSKEELIGQDHRILKSGYHPPEFYQGIWNTITSGKIWRGDIKNVAKDGTYYWVRTAIMPVLDYQKKPIQYIAVRIDITNQKKIEEELRIALDELKETDKLKDEFGSMISHELRTPLIPIMGYCEMLMDPNLSTSVKESQLESIREIYKNSKRLLKMIEDILTVQKFEMKQMKFEKKDVSLMSFMKNIMDSYMPAMKEKMIGFTNTTSEDYIIKTDPDKIMQVFGNLIQNAIDFVPHNGLIEIGAKSDDDSTIFHVKDNGFGIPKEKQKELFNKFYQADTSIKRKHGGTGLGLSICREIVKGMGGKIWVESDEGKRTTFYFTIPKNNEGFSEL